MSDEPRISPVDPDTAEGALKEIVDGNRSRWGKPLLPYLLYARSPAVFTGTMAMWRRVGSRRRENGQRQGENQSRNPHGGGPEPPHRRFLRRPAAGT